MIPVPFTVWNRPRNSTGTDSRSPSMGRDSLAIGRAAHARTSRSHCRAIAVIAAIIAAVSRGSSRQHRLEIDEI